MSDYNGNDICFFPSKEVDRSEQRQLSELLRYKHLMLTLGLGLLKELSSKLILKAHKKKQMTSFHIRQIHSEM